MLAPGRERRLRYGLRCAVSARRESPQRRRTLNALPPISLLARNAHATGAALEGESSEGHSGGAGGEHRARGHDACRARKCAPQSHDAFLNSCLPAPALPGSQHATHTRQPFCPIPAVLAGELSKRATGFLRTVIARSSDAPLFPNISCCRFPTLRSHVHDRPGRLPRP